MMRYVAITLSMNNREALVLHLVYFCKVMPFGPNYKVTLIFLVRTLISSLHAIKHLVMVITPFQIY